MDRPPSIASTRRRWLAVASAVAVSTGLAASGPLRISRAAPEVGADHRDRKAGACQVTVIGILATPDSSGGAIDPRLASLKAPLRKLLPRSGFKLIDVKSDRISGGNSVRCSLGEESSARVTLMDALDPSGKARLRCELTQGGRRLSTSEVTTPLNQLFFCEHKRSDGTTLLVGIGAR